MVRLHYLPPIQQERNIMTTNRVTVKLTDGSVFVAEVAETEDGWEAYIPHLDATGRGRSQKEAIVDALNESSAGL